MTFITKSFRIITSIFLLLKFTSPTSNGDAASDNSIMEVCDDMNAGDRTPATIQDDIHVGGAQKCIEYLDIQLRQKCEMNARLLNVGGFEIFESQQLGNNATVAFVQAVINRWVWCLRSVQNCRYLDFVEYIKRSEYITDFFYGPNQYVYKKLCDNTLKDKSELYKEYIEKNAIKQHEIVGAVYNFKFSVATRTYLEGNRYFIKLNESLKHIGTLKRMQFGEIYQLHMLLKFINAKIAYIRDEDEEITSEESIYCMSYSSFRVSADSKGNEVCKDEQGKSVKKSNVPNDDAAEAPGKYIRAAKYKNIGFVGESLERSAIREREGTLEIVDIKNQIFETVFELVKTI